VKQGEKLTMIVKPKPKVIPRSPTPTPGIIPENDVASSTPSHNGSHATAASAVSAGRLKNSFPTSPVPSPSSCMVGSAAHNVNVSSNNAYNTAAATAAVPATRIINNNSANYPVASATATRISNNNNTNNIASNANNYPTASATATRISNNNGTGSSGGYSGTTSATATRISNNSYTTSNPATAAATKIRHGSATGHSGNAGSGGGGGRCVVLAGLKDGKREGGGGGGGSGLGKGSGGVGRSASLSTPGDGGKQFWKGHRAGGGGGGSSTTMASSNKGMATSPRHHHHQHSVSAPTTPTPSSQHVGRDRKAWYYGYTCPVYDHPLPPTPEASVWVHASMYLYS
jgi:hypothetical protein